VNISFVIPGEPFGKERAGRRIVRGAAVEFVQSYNPPKTRKAEKVIATCARHAWGARPLLSGVPVQMVVRCYMPIPPSWTKRKQIDAVAGRVRPISKPDWDNLGKLVSDALNEIIYEDDRVIWDAHVIKEYARDPREVRTEISLSWPDQVVEPAEAELFTVAV
jgi:Holliday junction resolvase RusA-like endonuclease